MTKCRERKRRGRINTVVALAGLLALVGGATHAYGASKGDGGKAAKMAQELWQEIAGHEKWATVPGKGTFYAGQPPHGALLSTYLNPAAEKGMEAKGGKMPNDAIIVKDNYMPDKTLAAITVMYKEPGYDRKHKDWFWAKYAPDGKVQAAGKAPGCISCHGSVRSNDYIFTFPVAPIKP